MKDKILSRKGVPSGSRGNNIRRFPPIGTIGKYVLACLATVVIYHIITKEEKPDYYYLTQKDRPDIVSSGHGCKLTLTLTDKSLIEKYGRRDLEGLLNVVRLDLYADIYSFEVKGFFNRFRQEYIEEKKKFLEQILEKRDQTPYDGMPYSVPQEMKDKKIGI